MMAYLVEMAVRLVELHRVLKPTGSLYLHCDPTASHYLKLILDALFGPMNFRSEIVWKRTTGHSDANRPGAVHDILLFYSKTDKYTWNKTFQEYDAGYVEAYYRYTDTDGRHFMSADLTGAGQGPPRTFGERGEIPAPDGRHWMFDQAGIDKAMQEGRIFWTRNGVPRLKQFLDQAQGMPLQDIWSDVQALRSWHKEGLGWQTQKPLALLERIIQASSNPGDLVLDPFCGCGTAVAAAQKLDRKWIGIDITYLSIAVMKARLKDSFGIEVPVIGQPTEVEGARQLAQGDDGRYQFQWWALNLIDARPLGGTEKKGADRGIDGRITFTVGGKGEMGQALVSVKSGGVNSSMIRDLKGTIEREGAQIGLFITLEEPSKPMLLEASTAGVYTSPISGKDYPRLQILTIRQLLEEHAKPMLPLLLMPTYQQAERISAKQAAEQKELFG
jgi:site-specific DNA-methyltransferase (adenine-specific)